MTDDGLHATEEGGLSLDDLSRAFAEALGRGDDPYQPAPAKGPVEPPLPEQSEGEAEGADQTCDISPRSILEAMLFVGHPDNEPLTSGQVASLMRGVTPQEVDELVLELNEAYRAEGRPYEVVSSGAGYRLELRREFAPLRAKFFGQVKEARLSQATIDILALVAYHQPVTRQQVDELRGKPSGALLNQLVRRQLLRIESSEEKPRVTRYFTTDRFLDLFGLESLGDLPRSQDLDRA